MQSRCAALAETRNRLRRTWLAKCSSSTIHSTSSTTTTAAAATTTSSSSSSSNSNNNKNRRSHARHWQQSSCHKRQLSTTPATSHNPNYSSSKDWRRSLSSHAIHNNSNSNIHNSNNTNNTNSIHNNSHTRPMHTTSSYASAFLSDHEYDNDDEYLDDTLVDEGRNTFSLSADDLYNLPWEHVTRTNNTSNLLDLMNPDHTELATDSDSDPVSQTQPSLVERARKLSAVEILLKFETDPPDPSNLEEVQLWLECLSQRETELKYEKMIKDARERGDYGSMHSVQHEVLSWFQGLQDAIDAQQRAYILKDREDKTVKARHSCGPYLCSLPPQKLAIITAHVAVMHAIAHDGDGAHIVSMAMAIADSMEAEVNVQRAMRKQLEQSPPEIKERYEQEIISKGVNQTKTSTPTLLGGTSKDPTTAATNKHASDPTTVEKNNDEDENDYIFDSWVYGPSHLRRFVEESTKGDFGTKQRMRVEHANSRALSILNSDEKWNKTAKIQLGVALLNELIATATVETPQGTEPAFKYDLVYNHETKKKYGRIGLNETLYKKIVEDGYRSFAPISSRHKPMVLPPRKWVSPHDGAYSWLNVNLMRTHGCNTQDEALHCTDLTTAFDGLNDLGKVPWVINKDILSVAQRCWKENIPLGEIPSHTDFAVPHQPVPPERINVDVWNDKESEGYKMHLAEFLKYKEAYRKHKHLHQKNMDLRSLRCSTILKLDQAEQFKDYKAVYFPYNMDFRGRAYPVPPHLSNVGSDLCRGVLKFAESKALGPRGLYWLKVHLANLGGNDKMSFDQRADFTDRNMENARASVADPFGENNDTESKETPWWMTLEDPFQGLATCQEIVNAIDSGDPESYLCSLPVHMDGSCNGLQHYAALGLDTIGGKAVNLCSSDEPSDVYIGVMEEVIRRVAEEAAKELEFDESDPDALTKKERKALKDNRSAKLVNGIIDRGVVKRTVMTSVYGVTFIGAKNQIQEKILEKLEGKGVDVYELDNDIYVASGYLARMTMDVMGKQFSGAKKTMNWLTQCARLIAQYGQPVAWMSPIGLPCVQPYRQKKSFTVVTLLQQVVLVDSSDDLPIHKTRQVSAFPPNYVHSLDSSHMLLTALEMNKRGLTFSAVHDSFWTHPCDVEEMNVALRDCFVELYEQPLLETLKDSWEMRYPDIVFPEIPEKGDLDLNEVKSAPYFFQ